MDLKIARKNATG